MNINTDKIVSVSEVNQNFSNVLKKVDREGSVVVMKNNKPKYVIQKIEGEMFFELTEDEKIEIIAKRILKNNKKAFEKLGKL